jgi:iron complex outermembrane receptor protein
VSKASKRLRRHVAGAPKSRASELAIFIAGATLLSPLAFAQDQDASSKADNSTTKKTDDDMAEVLVTGIRKALETSQEIKKEADTVIDSITASDIGAFPDKSVAEALQRVTGVAVTRFAASGDTTHFSAEPSGVIIRGLPQVRSEFNGRDSFNANSSRGLSFGDVSPELMAGVDTYKNSTADMIEGGIAGTVNLRTHVPFDSEGFVLAASADLGYGDLTEEAKPSGSLIMSNRWDTGIGEFGLMGNIAYSEVTTQSQGTQIGRFFQVDNVAAYGGGTKWIPGGVDIRMNDYDRKRTGLSFAGQYQSPEKAVLATVQYNKSKYVNEWTEFSLTAGLSGASTQTAQDLVLTNQLAFAPTGTRAYTFDSNGMFLSGVMADTTGAWNGPSTNDILLEHPNGFPSNTGHNGGGPGPDGIPGNADDPPITPTHPGQPIDQPFLSWACNTQYDGATNGPTYCNESTTRGVGLSADSRFSTQTNVTDDVSANVRWNVNDNIGINFDVQNIKSTVVNFDNSMNDKTFADLDLDISHGKPKFSVTPAKGWGMTPGGFADPQNYYHEWTMEHAENSEGEEWAERIDADIKLDAGWFDALRVGVRRAEREQDINWSTYNWGSVQPLWGIKPGENVFLNESPWQGTYQEHDMGSSLVGGGVFAGGVFLHPNMQIVKNYQTTIDTFEGLSNSWVPLGSRTNCGPLAQGLYCPVEQQKVSEDTDAAYVMLKFGGDDAKIGNISVRGNIGVRFVKTEVSAVGGIQFPIFNAPANCTPSPGNPVTALCLTPADDRTFMNQATLSQTGGADHTNYLPSLNVRFGVTDTQFVRFAASRALARPDMGLYKNYLSVGLVQPGCGNGTVTYSTPGDCTSNPIAYTPRYTAEAGNPALAPTTADQLDLTYEWYFSNTGSLTAAVFYKKFNDYIQYGSFTRDFTNNGVTRQVEIRGPITGDGAKLHGFEVAYQSFLDKLPSPWNGFGYQLNFTWVKNQGITNSNLTTVSGGGTVQQDPLITFNKLPLEGYSKTTYNVVAMYEQGKYSARLAYNWRDKYLISQSDCCIKLPIWQDAYGQLDGSFHFKPQESWDVFLEAQNLTKSETVLRQQVTNDGLTLPRSWFVNDRRFQVGVRYRFQ